MNLNKFMIGSLPGAIAFMYYSGSLILVFLGAFILTLLMNLSERVVLFITSNSVLCAIDGASIANTVAQFGVAPRMMLKHYFLIFLYCFILYFIQLKRKK